MRAEFHLTSAEMGAATVVMLAQLQDCKTEKQAQQHWNRIAALLRTTLQVLCTGKKQHLPRNAKLVSIWKTWQPDGSFTYTTAWEWEDGI